MRIYKHEFFRRIFNHSENDENYEMRLVLRGNREELSEILYKLTAMIRETSL